jgi:hypothetical protein
MNLLLSSAVNQAMLVNQPYPFKYFLVNQATSGNTAPRRQRLAAMAGIAHNCEPDTQQGVSP